MICSKRHELFLLDIIHVSLNNIFFYNSMFPVWLFATPSVRDNSTADDFLIVVKDLLGE